jgi:hypothetical protein
VRTNTEYAGRPASQRLADLRKRAAELERRLSDARAALEHELARGGRDQAVKRQPAQETLDSGLDDWPPADDWPPGDDWAPASDWAPGRDWVPGIDPGAGEFHGDDEFPGTGDFPGDGEYSGTGQFPRDREFPGAAEFSGNGQDWPGKNPDSAATPQSGNGHDPAKSAGQVPPSDGRTASLVNNGRHTAHRRVSRWRLVAVGMAALAVTVLVLTLVLRGNGPSWPPSVTVVQSEIATACQNPDVSSEPGQVNFACAKATRQILWVFSLMTSSDNPDFTDAMTGRVGLEPITPAQGGELAWSLNLHHPYDPSNPIDSLEVAARAINNIVGGATLTAANGRPVIQSGLESRPANCVRYTGSAAMRSRPGFPGQCAKPVAGRWGQAALVTDIYRKWVIGAPPAEAQDAAVLFENAQNPGNPRVQAILRQLQSSKP